MPKTMTVLAMAVWIVAAMVLPATASATWKDHGTTIQENETINFTGTAAFTSIMGGVTCQVTSQTQFFGNSTTGEVETFDIHPQDETTNCKGTGNLGGCQVHDVTPQTDLNWSFHTIVGSNIVQITTQSLTSTMTGLFCPVSKIVLNAGNVTATPNQPNTVTSVTLSGNTQVTFVTSHGPIDIVQATVTHSLTIEDAADKHTYDI